MTRSLGSRPWLGLTILLLGPSAAPIGAPATRPATTPDSVEIVAGPRYGGGRIRRFLLGSGYRDLWTTPMRVEVLDLRCFAGGLRPHKLGGGNQTQSLRFMGATESSTSSGRSTSTAACGPNSREPRWRP